MYGIRRMYIIATTVCLSELQSVYLLWQHKAVLTALNDTQTYTRLTAQAHTASILFTFYGWTKI
jgi:hypothetical protein